MTQPYTERLVAGEWAPEKHPRDAHGRFGDGADVIEAMRNDPRVAAADKLSWARGDVRNDAGVSVNKHYTPEAVEENRRIAASFLSDGAKARTGEAPVAVIVVGRPGAGKSTLLGGSAGATLPKTVLINPDDVKERLAGYRPELAGAYHRRSTDIVKELWPMVVNGRYNVTYDVSGRDPHQMTDIAERLVDHGYKLHVIGVQTNAKVANQRVYDRFLGGGRLVSPDVLSDHAFAQGPRVSYEKLKEMADEWTHYDTSEEQPRLVEHGTRSGAGAAGSGPRQASEGVGDGSGGRGGSGERRVGDERGDDTGVGRSGATEEGDGRQLSEGNPNHDATGLFASSPGGKNGSDAEPSDGVKLAIKAYTAKDGSAAGDYRPSDEDRAALSSWLEQGHFSGEAYRGFGISDKDAETNPYLKEGSDITLNGMTSFTTQKDRTGGYSSGENHVRVTVEGGLQGRDIAKFSQYPEENEVLVPKGATFTVAKVEPVYDTTPRNPAVDQMKMVVDDGKGGFDVVDAPPTVERWTGRYNVTLRAKANKHKFAEPALDVYGLGDAPEDAEAMLRFDMQNPDVVMWVDTRAAELVRQISEGQQTLVRNLLHDSFVNGVTPTETASRIRMVVGLTDQQASYIERYTQRLLEQGVIAPKAKALADRYRANWIKYRANTIARTEVTSASNEGQALAWGQATAHGYLDPLELQETWVISPDAHACLACRELEGKRWPMGAGPRPPKHPGCRCSKGLVRQGSGPARTVPLPDYVPRDNVYKLKPKLTKASEYEAQVRLRSLEERGLTRGAQYDQLRAFVEHDVSDEARDSGGKWTGGSGTSSEEYRSPFLHMFTSGNKDKEREILTSFGEGFHHIDTPVGQQAAVWFDHLDNPSKAAVIEYQAGSFGMNAQLRNEKWVSDKDRALSDQLDEAFSSAPRLADPLVVYRGVDKATWEQIQSSQSVTDRGFTSTSLDKSEATEYARIGEGRVLEIHLAAGTKGVQINSSSDKSEYLLPRGSQFRVDGERLILES